MRVGNIIRIISALVALLFLYATPLSAQYHKERKLVREGNSSFVKKNYNTSYNRYNEALEHDAANYEALYNRANAYTQLRRSNPQDSTLTAEVEFRNYESIAADTLLSKSQRAEVLRNFGESLFNEQKYEAALNAFRESLLLNPQDKETKYDYVLTKRIVDQKRHQQEQNPNQDNNQNNNQQNDNQDNNQENNNQNQDNQGDQNKDNKNDQSEGDQPEQDKPQEGDEPQDEEQEGDETPEPKELNADQERMLNAIQAEEDKTQEKLKDGKKALVVPGKKNW